MKPLANGGRETTRNNTTENTGAIEGTKEEILYMLKISLEANVEHAAANRDNSKSLLEIVKQLGLKINSTMHCWTNIPSS